MKNCTIKGCNRPQAARGWCPRHHQRWLRHGSPLRTLRDSVYEPLRNRLMKRIRKVVRIKRLGACWEWTGLTGPYDGYGVLKYKGILEKAHRLSYKELIGPIPMDKPMILHKCDNRSCINPRHLQPGTKIDNANDCVNRGRHFQSNQTHCKRGHRFDAENTRLSHGDRVCRACARLHAREFRARKAASQ